MASDEVKEADFVTIVSSEMIAEVMEAYFNKAMYKKKVEIVDLKSTETGYMFSLAFVTQQKTAVMGPLVGPSGIYPSGQTTVNNNGHSRDDKGRYKRKVQV